MKKEILFRGKVSIKHKNLTWTQQGCWIQGSLLIEDHIATRIIQKDGNWAYVDEATIGQYTGRSDKNGKKIFEGDIVIYKGDSNLSFEIDFNVCGYLSPLTDMASDWLPTDDFLYERPKSFEVIGNVCQDLQE